MISSGLMVLLFEESPLVVTDRTRAGVDVAAGLRCRARERNRPAHLPDRTVDVDWLQSDIRHRLRCAHRVRPLDCGKNALARGVELTTIVVDRGNDIAVTITRDRSQPQRRLPEVSRRRTGRSASQVLAVFVTHEGVRRWIANVARGPEDPLGRL